MTGFSPRVLAAHMRNAEPVERQRETRFNVGILALTVAGVLGMALGLVLGKL